MRLAAAELVESREIVPGQWLQSWHAPALAAGTRAGQFAHVRLDDGAGMAVRWPHWLNTVDVGTGIVTIHFAVSRVGGGLERLRPGDVVDMFGPLGRPFEVDSRNQHLVLVAEGASIAGLRLLADEAIRDGRQVVVISGTPSAASVYPSRLLPDEVEYVVATADGSMGHHGSVVDLVPEYEAWADQAFACGPAPMLGELARLLAGRRERMGVASLGRKRGRGRVDAPGSAIARRKSFLQVAIDHSIGCAGAVCLGCTVPGSNGQPLRACREGPVFAAAELDWEAPW